MPSRLNWERTKREAKALKHRATLIERRRTQQLRKRLIWQQALDERGWIRCPRCKGGMHPLNALCNQCQLKERQEKHKQTRAMTAHQTRQCVDCLRPIKSKFKHCYSCSQHRRRALAYDGK